MPQFPLDGLIVLDLSHALAGPYCTMLMATYGARVIKVEATGSGDMGRTWGPPFNGTDASFFLGINAGKQAIAIDLKDPRGIELCRELIAQADILIENFRPGTMDRLGLGYDTVREINPRLIYCSISGYGQTGPQRDGAAMDLILQAASGLLSMTGTDAGELVRCGHSVADVTAGMFALIGVLMALRTREETGRGQAVDISMLDGMISAMASAFANLFGSGVSPRPRGTAFGTIVPYACFPTGDRDIGIAVASERLWQAFCQAIDRSDLAEDRRFCTNAVRVEHRVILESLIVETFRSKPAAEWLAILGRHGVPCSLVNTLAEVASGPQAAARDMFPTVTHPVGGPTKVTGAPIKFSESLGQVRTPAPLHGQHTRDVIRDLLGRTDRDLDGLIEDGVVAS